MQHGLQTYGDRMYDEGAVPLSQFLIAENHTQIYTMFKA